ncbi:MAG: glycosyltransferase [Gaiellaceae bacterium]
MRGLLSATLIVRDEEDVLGACLGSICDVVDEIVIVDTGSVDASIEIARSFGALVREHAWTGDFAEPRNRALELASGEWILYIDADEELAPVTRGQVEGLLTDVPEVAFRLLLRPTPQSTPYLEYRIWRNDPRIRFEGLIHEKVTPAIHAVAETDGRPIGRSDLLLSHAGYEGDQTHKHLRNLPLLQAELKVDPDNMFNLHHFARVQEGLGRPDEAERALERAVEVARGPGRKDPIGCLVFGELVRLRRDLGKDASGLLEEARSRYPGNYLLLFHEGRLRVDEARYAEALDVFDRLLAVDQTVLADEGPSYDQAIFGVLSHEARALCLMGLERYDEAAEAYASAEECAPDDPSLPVKQQLARARARAA